MNKEEADLIIAEQNKSKEEILKAVAKVKSDYHELCKLKDMRIAELEKENAELRKVAEFQQSSNMSRHFENKKLKEGLAVGSTFNKALNSMNKNLEEERDKYRNMVFDKDEHLIKAKEIIKELVRVEYADFTNGDYSNELSKVLEQAEQFLNSEVEK